MAITIDGLRLVELLRSSTRTQVWAGEREADGEKVIAKVFSLEGDSEFEARVQHEFEQLMRLDIPGVVRALSLERSGHQLVLILAAHEGVNLAEYRGSQAIAVRPFLDIAVQLASILDAVHQRRVIHRDIKPTNIVIDPNTGSIALADFGISVVLQSARRQLHDAEIVEGTLPYMSPEQTGRTGREVDYRSDLYALGTTFYELITGRRLFPSDSALELIHAHLARRPQAPARIRPELPSALSELIMKLLEKAPERRYQSAAGLLADLTEIQRRLGQGQPLDDFPLGGSDVPLTLQLSQVLYGRDSARAQLLEQFEGVREGAAALTVLQGESGVGKSALIGELTEAVLAVRGFMARGIFEPGQDQRPFSAFVGALEDLADQLLTLPPDSLQQWRLRLTAALTGYVPVILDFVPRLRPLLEFEADPDPELQTSISSSGDDAHGTLDWLPAPALPEVAPAEARNRIEVACGRLLACFAKPEHPLVLALDNLQWCDTGSLSLLEGVFAERDIALFVVVTARPEAFNDSHPALDLLARLRSRGVQPTIVELGPLEAEDLQRMLAELLSRPPSEVTPLVDLLQRKTGGNPFFVRQFLIHLAEHQLLTHTPSGWTWDDLAIEGASLPEDVLDMMTAKLDRLGELDGGLRELITVASVFGGEFDAPSVERVSKSSRARVGLHRLADEGLLSALTGRGYSFAHERLREAAYSRLSPDRARALHLAVGRDLQANLSEEELERRVFDVADHLNRGYALTGVVTADSQVLPYLDDLKLERLAELNLAAGRRALLSGAPGPGRTYLSIARSLATLLTTSFPAKDEEHHGLSFEIEFRLAQSEALIGGLEAADAQFAALAELDIELSQLGQIAIERCWILAMAGRTDEAIAQAFDVVRRLGVSFPTSPGPIHLVTVLPRTAWHLRPASIARWLNLPRSTNSRINVAIEILFATTWTSYAASPYAFAIAIERAASLIHEHGDHELAPNIFALLAMVLGNAFGKRERAQELVVQSRELVEARTVSKGAHNIIQLEHFLQLWTSPLGELTDKAIEIFELGLAAGDVRSASYAAGFATELSFYAGVHLEVVERHAQSRTRWLERWRIESPTSANNIPAACDLLLRGSPPQPGSAADTRVDLLAIRGDNEQPLVRWANDLVATTAHVVFERWAEALALSQGLGIMLLRKVPDTWHPIFALFFEALAASALALEEPKKYPRSSPLQRVARRNTRKLAAIVRGGGNFEMLSALSQAQVAALDSRFERAGALYLRAIAVAHEHKNTMIEALAHERLAKLALLQNIPSFAEGPYERARERYLHWGAFTKVELLDARRPRAPEPSLSLERPIDSSAGIRARSSTSTGSSSPNTTHTMSHTSLDVATLLEASRTLTEDIRLAEVVERILALAIENAGANRGALVLSDARELTVVAESSSEGEVQSHVDAPVPLSRASQRLPATLLRWVERTGEAIVLSNIDADPRFSADPYLHHAGERAVLCTPLTKQGNLVGLLYLENHLHADAFTRDRLETMRVLASQAAAALENARLYDDLRASEVRWRSLVEQLPDYVVLAGQKGRINLVNPGQAPEQAPINRALRKLVKAGREDPNHPLSAVLAGKGERAFEQAITTPEGERRWLDVRVAPLSVDGQVERALLVATEITERKRAAAQREHFEAQLRQQQRLESIGTLAGGVAHEINNPVQGIMNYAELIAGSSAADEMIREFAGEIDFETQRVATIVRNLLAFAREDQDADMTTVHPKAIVDATLSLVTALIRKDQIQVEVELPEDLPEVRCRSQQIQQVVMNLVTNARDALNEHFTGYHADKRLIISAESFLREGQPWLRINIADRGGGVPEDASLRIFDPFFTTKGRDRGTGLGLSISHSIIQDHGGELRLLNHPGQSATFVIELPVAGPDEPDEPDAGSDADPDPVS